MNRINECRKNGFEPLYRPIMNGIIQKIHDGVYRPGGKIASVRELADEYNVSRQVAHTALCKLIELNYLYAEPKRGIFVNPTLKPGLFYRLAMYINEKNPMRGAYLMHKIYEACLENSFDVVLGSNYQTAGSIGSFLKRDTHFDGVLMYGAINDKILEEVKSFHVPYLVLGNYHISPEHPQLRIDVRSNVRKMLIENFAAFSGKKIAGLFGIPDDTGLEFEAGFYDAVKAVGAVTSPQMLKRCTVDGYAECLELFAEHSPDVLLVLEGLRPGYRKYCQLKKPVCRPFTIGTVYSRGMMDMEDEFIDRQIHVDSGFSDKMAEGVRLFLKSIKGAEKC